MPRKCLFIWFGQNLECPFMQETDDKTLRRFLRARDHDIDKASTMFLKCLKWRRSAIPNGFISEEEVKNELAQGKVYMQGFDKTGRPIAIVYGAKHYYSNREMNEFKRKNLDNLSF
jgi:CRAL/TRIO, N-terminal domain